MASDHEKVALLLKELDGRHPHNACEARVELLNEFGADHVDLQTSARRLENLLHLIVRGEGLQRYVRPRQTHQAAFHHEGLLLLEKVDEFPLVAKGLQGLADADPVLVAVEKAELVRREVTRLQQLRELLHEAGLRGPNYKVQGAPVLHTAIREPLTPLEDLAIAHEVLIWKRHQLCGRDTLLGAEDGILRADGEFERRSGFGLGRSLKVDLNLHCADMENPTIPLQETLTKLGYLLTCTRRGPRDFL